MGKKNEGPPTHNVCHLRSNDALSLVKGLRVPVNANHRDHWCSLLRFIYWNLGKNRIVGPFGTEVVLFFQFYTINILIIRAHLRKKTITIYFYLVWNN